MDKLKDRNLEVTYRDPKTLNPSDDYQAFDPLPKEARKALHDDIQSRGIQVPVEIDQNGNILDGHNRVEIAKELKYHCPVIVHEYAKDEDKLEHAVKANLLRRQVSPISWARAMQRLLDVKKIGRKTKHNGNTPTDDTLSRLYKEVGVNMRTAQRRFELFDALKDYPDLMRQVDTEEKSAAEAKREAVKLQGKDKAKKTKKAGTIDGLYKAIEQCIKKYRECHDIVAKIHKHKDQIIIDVEELIRTEKFSLSDLNEVMEKFPNGQLFKLEDIIAVYPDKPMQEVKEFFSKLRKQDGIEEEKQGKGGKIHLRFVQEKKTVES